MPYKSKKLKAINTESLDKLGDSVVDLAKWTEDEFAQLATDLQNIEPGPISYVPPPRPRMGTVVYADGVRWNPGHGEGTYFYNSTGAWIPEFQYSFTSTAGLMQLSGNQTVTGGFNVTPNNIGTVSSGTVTPNPMLGNYQYYTNNGAHTLAAPASDCGVDILITNGASAGAITFTGFTVGASTGDALTTTNTSKFIISIRRINAISTYTIKALQ